MTLCEKHMMMKDSLLQSKPVIYANNCRRRGLWPSPLTSQLRVSHRGGRGRVVLALQRSRCLLQQPGWKQRELDSIKTSSVGFCHQWLLQHRSLWRSLWPVSSSFYLFIFYSAWTYTFSLECVFSVCSCRLCWHSSWVFFPIILSQAFVNLCDCVLEFFFVSMLKECLGVSIYGKIWSDGMAAGWDLHSSNLHGLIREGTLRLSQLVVSHGLHPNRHQHYQILLYSPAMHMDCLNNLALLTGNVSLTETTQYFPILFVLICSWWRPEAERLLKGQRGCSRRMNR